MTAQTTALTQVHVSAALPATYDGAGYAALTWSKVGEVDEIPTFGPKGTVNTFIPVDTAIVQKAVGSVDYGSPVFSFARNSSDAGQVILSAAMANKTAISVRITRPSGQKDYFSGIVSSDERIHGGVNGFFMGTSQVDATTAVVTV